MLVLGIEVEQEVLDVWRNWLMPAVQPFVVPHDVATEGGWADGRDRLSAELRDSFELYGLLDSQAVVWLSRRQARQLPETVRHAQPGAHRWPSVDADRDRARAIRWIEAGRRPSRHREVNDAHWARVRTLLPGARRLAGRFPSGSGPNCFGTVMAVAGVTSAAMEWMQIEPFESWLAAWTESGGKDDEPGTVLVWRDRDGRPVHAAIALGGGWLIHKPSQGWMSPVKVLAVRDGKYSARTPGRYLSRHHIS